MTNKGASFVGWGSIITGREKKAPEVLNDAGRKINLMPK
jgi:hypothetical protein